MKRQLLFCLLFLAGMAAHAQTYQCIQPTEQPRFTNSNNYLRGMRIDSVVADGANTIYYPYHSARSIDTNFYVNGTDNNGASWMGSKIVGLPDGTFLFDNIWHDTVVIKCAAALGDSWTFYDDSLSRVYIATVTGIDTGRVAGNLDSIKTITITADSAGIANPADSANGMQLKLSKYNGFAQVIDLYAFPYKNSGGIWYAGTDFWTEAVAGTLGVPDASWFTAPLTSSLLVFQQVHYHNPDMMDIYEFNVGDIFEYATSNSQEYGGGSVGVTNTTNEVDTITAKTVTPYLVTYTSKGISRATHSVASQAGVTNDTTGSAFATHLFVSADTSHVFSDTAMPEEYTLPFQQYYTYSYDPQADTTTCGSHYVAGIYQVSFGNCTGGTIAGSQPFTSGSIYTSGFGVSGFGSSCNGGQPQMDYSSGPTYVHKNGSDCLGAYSPIVLGIVDLQEQGGALAPNPVSGNLSITVGNSSLAYTVTLYNVAGQLLLTQKAVGNIVISLAHIPAGLYTFVLQTQNGNRMTRKVSVLH